MHRVIDLSFKSLCQQLFFAITLLAACSLAWGEADLPSIAGSAEEPGLAGAPASDVKVEEKKWLLSFDNPREMTGIVIGGIVVNLTLITVFFALLWKEWKKHKAAPKAALDGKSESG